MTASHPHIAHISTFRVCAPPTSKLASYSTCGAWAVVCPTLCIFGGGGGANELGHAFLLTHAEPHVCMHIASCPRYYNVDDDYDDAI